LIIKTEEEKPIASPTILITVFNLYFNSVRKASLKKFLFTALKLGWFNYPLEAFGREKVTEK